MLFFEFFLAGNENTCSLYFFGGNYVRISMGPGVFENNILVYMVCIC
jgi:hypothetical protein